MRLLVAFLFLGLAAPGCPKPLPPAPTPSTDLPPCRSAVWLAPEDDCGTATRDYPYYRCAACGGGSGCVAMDLQIYCVAVSCADDFTCGAESARRRR